MRRSMNEGNERTNDGSRAADSARSVSQALVDLAKELLEADRCELLIEEDGRLVVQASSDPRSDDTDRSYPLWAGLVGQAYTTGTSCVIDDQHDTRSVSTAASNEPTASESYRSLCCTPIEEGGLLLAKARQPGAFSDADQELAELLVELARSSLDASPVEPTPVLDGGGPKTRDHAELLEEIADILSHDLKNPLSVVRGNLELARETGDDRFFEKASNGLQRIEELIDGVVFLAQTGDLVEEMTTVDLGERARSAWGNVETEQARLQVEGSVEFWASNRGVDHLLENLIENAVTHAGPDVTVHIGILDEGFYVEDDGPGIPAEHHDRIFERGYTRESNSSGLGLHIVKRIADAHGWTLDVESPPNGGTRFEITAVDISN